MGGRQIKSYLYMINISSQLSIGGFRRGGAGGGMRPLFLQSFALCDYVEELQTVLIKVKLIIINALLT